ncbi:nucleotide exchange factor GrpE [Taibaiella soli]|uniref:Protein GrpE n=2 Tax=Taibaiella soli TaxID=1649169 RepID=A0A2W2B163_9BACT|nr:nucleotide exchange factor GrpE [Taibaiella soli]
MENQDNMTPDQNKNNEALEDALASELNVDDSMAGTQKLEDQLAEEDEMAKLKNEVEEAKDKYLRLVAEFENFRRRNAKERVELIQTAGKDIVQSLLVVLDDTDRASKQMEKSTDIDALKEGVGLVFNKLRGVMQQKGLVKMESIGQDFDPELHEAITEIPAPNETMVGKVIDVIEPGYYLNEKLIRHAKVVVGK